jgi:hypothetical protein
MVVERQKQIPGGNDNKKCNGKGKGKSRYPAGMTNVRWV